MFNHWNGDVFSKVEWMESLVSVFCTSQYVFHRGRVFREIHAFRFHCNMTRSEFFCCCINFRRETEERLVSYNMIMELQMEANCCGVRGLTSWRCYWKIINFKLLKASHLVVNYFPLPAGPDVVYSLLKMTIHFDRGVA